MAFAGGAVLGAGILIGLIVDRRHRRAVAKPVPAMHRTAAASRAVRPTPLDFPERCRLAAAV